jgi:hypothetical protein
LLLFHHPSLTSCLWGLSGTTQGPFTTGGSVRCVGGVLRNDARSVHYGTLRRSCITLQYNSPRPPPIHRNPDAREHRLQVGWVLQEHSSEFFPVEPGIPSSATRRTRKLSPA